MTYLLERNFVGQKWKYVCLIGDENFAFKIISPEEFFQNNNNDNDNNNNNMKK